MCRGERGGCVYFQIYSLKSKTRGKLQALQLCGSMYNGTLINKASWAERPASFQTRRPFIHPASRGTFESMNAFQHVCPGSNQIHQRGITAADQGVWDYLRDGAEIHPKSEMDREIIKLIPRQRHCERNTPGANYLPDRTSYVEGCSCSGPG